MMFSFLMESKFGCLSGRWLLVGRHLRASTDYVVIQVVPRHFDGLVETQVVCQKGWLFRGGSEAVI
ncbi:MAG: hypothetical protein CMJ81_04130 [Planctomycetaceae bacterium]|nr:hypothetical protein [Planctomycetaceae bacterium]MBP62753.1 hypothetical protein [Planctomycetaceae bacterium]